MATAVLRSHDALDNRMHLETFGASPSKPRRRRGPKPAAAAAATSPAPKPEVTSAAPKPAVIASPAPKAAAAAGRRSPPARTTRKQASPTKEKPKQRMVMEEVRILKRGQEPPAPARAPSPPPVLAVAQAAPAEQRVVCSTNRIGPKQPAVVPTKIVATVAANASGYAGPAFSAAAPEPSSLPFPAFFLRCLLRIGELS